MEVFVAILVGLLVLGVVLIFLEIFVIPGTTFFGIAGGVLLVAGIFGTYKYYGDNWGHISIVASVGVFFVLFVLGRKLLSKDKVTLSEAIDGKVNELEFEFSVGDKGKSITEIRPSGKAHFNEHKVEVFSNGAYIEKGVELEIVKISGNKIIVKPLN
jgi:membrane-bound ClpP family serine protease